MGSSRLQERPRATTQEGFVEKYMDNAKLGDYYAGSGVNIANPGEVNQVTLRYCVNCNVSFPDATVMTDKLYCSSCRAVLCGSCDVYHMCAQRSEQRRLARDDKCYAGLV